MKQTALALSILLACSANAFAESTPDAAVKEFYQAVVAQDCAKALQLRPDFSNERCKNITAAKVVKTETLASDEKQAIVKANINVTSENKPQNFDGFVYLEHAKNGWQLKDFGESEKTTEAEFTAKHMASVEASPAVQQAPVAQNQASQTASADSVDLANAAATLADLRSRFPEYAKGNIALVDVDNERMAIFQGDQKIADFPISAAAKGAGNQSGSDQTPLGAHRIAQKFGDGAAKGSIFEARKDTGKIADILTAPVDVPTDYVTTRVLWLEGLEPGKNKGGNVDSKNRFIYIHGTPEEGLIGRPASHGCIRMKNDDVIKAFQLLDENTLVYIGH